MNTSNIVEKNEDVVGGGGGGGGGGGSSSSSSRCGMVAAVAIVSVHCLFNDAVNSSDYRAE